jgi:hypothetical protein
MAMLDWEEWIQPWNWTVRAENTSTVIVSPSHCTHTPLTLLAFFGENIIFLLFSIALSILKVMYIHGREKELPWVVKFHQRCHFLVYLKFWQWPKRLRRENPGEEENESGRSQLLTSVLWSVLMTTVQVGLTFVSAYLITRTRGYHHVPLGRLALLFCCRPRLGWLACGLDYVTNEELLKSWFHFKKSKFIRKAQIALGSISVGAAISEFTLQLLSLYYMGLTANVGRIRGFYLLHRIRPFWRGRDAQHMYLGALFWLIGCVFIFITWVLVFFFSAQLHALRNGIYIRLRNLGRRAKFPAYLTKRFPWIKKSQEMASSDQVEIIRNGENQGVAGEKIEGDTGVAGERIENNGDVAGERIEHDQGVAGERLHDDPDGVAGERIQPVSDNQAETLLPRSSNFQEGEMSQRDRAGEIERIGMTSPVPSAALSSGTGTMVGQSTTLLGSHGSSTAVNNSPPLMTTAHGATRDDDSVKSAELVAQQTQDEEPHEETEDERKTRTRKELAIAFGLVIGMLTWAVQWAFWAGFVYTAGERYALLINPAAEHPAD